jgi:dihydroorotate dehydrogenase
MLYGILRPLLFAIDAETVHELAIRTLSVLEDAPIPERDPITDPVVERTLWGVHFPNPLGLAAGFDKNARLPHVWQRFGFGFVELGTVTALPQPGNARPRLFRLPEAGALINRLGFNNLGAKAISADLATRLRRRRPAIPLGINIGKSAVVELADAPADYAASYALLAPLADYVTINVSSPNTAGLRSLQATQSLTAIVGAIRAVPPADGADHPPLLIKVAPDLEDAELCEIADFALASDIDGLIATNTTIRRDSLPEAVEAGGLSGRPLAQRSTDVIRLLRRHSGGRIPIVGVGGIFDAHDAFAKIRAGADLVQMYTGFIYGGPDSPRRLVEALASLVREAGLASIAEAVGTDCG